MGLFEASERVMERWTTSLWGLLLPAKQERGEAVDILLRQCDDNTVIVGRQRVVVPNAFVVELLPEIHHQLLASDLPVAPVLSTEVRRHAAEQGYTFAGPVAVDLRPAPSDMTARFRIHSRITPAGRRPAE
ncbi:FhaA domain-containing protein [Streptomyces sp. NPDC001536]|uniref:FhaA domain-containing protein n=1 Tax=Streptomyces sp. NPDC001536 TaxID=3364583 RepID=UPI00368B2F0E